jgi:hypothetical protein
VADEWILFLQLWTNEIVILGCCTGNLWCQHSYRALSFRKEWRLWQGKTEVTLWVCSTTRIRTQVHWFLAALHIGYSTVSSVPWATHVTPVSTFFCSYDLVYKVTCALPAVWHVLLSLTGVWAPLGWAPLWHFSIIQEWDKVQICSRLSSLNPLLKNDSPESQEPWEEEPPKFF